MNEIWIGAARWDDTEWGLAASASGLREVILPHLWVSHPWRQRRKHPEGLSPYVDELTAYWSGRLTRWSVPLDLAGTDFQLSVWRALMDIPYGTVVTYGEVARRIGRPTAVRAVAAAVGQNPVPVVVPCHRVVGANGTLTGYRGGLALKARLLKLEGVTHIAQAGHGRFAFWV